MRGIYVSGLRLLGWIVYRGPKAIILRVMMQAFRIVTGRPVYRYSRVTPQLYVGGQHRRRGWASMHAYGINAVVNLRRRDDRKRGVAPPLYLHLPTRDNFAPSMEALNKGVQFITTRIAAGDVVYVHCGVGVGRAPTLVAAYLVSTGTTPEAAWERLREVRPFIFPMRGQVQQVQRYYEQLREASQGA